MPQATLRQMPALIEARKPFSGNSMRGEAFVGRVQRGVLPESVSLPGSARYVIYSYATPIAWEDHEGNVTIPDVRYSVTTSKHQGVVRRSFFSAPVPQLSLGA